MNPNDTPLRELERAKKELARLPGAEAHQRSREAFLAGTSVTSNGDMRHSDHSALMQIPKVSEGDRNMFARKTPRLRLIAAVLLGILLAGGFWAFPPLRTFAQEVINFFIPDPDNTRSTEIYFGVEPPEAEALPPSDLESMIAQATFEVYVPTFIPPGFRLTDARITNGIAFTTLTCTEPWSVIITQRPIERGLDSFGEEVGASAVIETIDINGVTGQYVHGGWDVVLPENFETLRQTPVPQQLAVESVWNNDLSWGRLLWIADEMVFELTSGGGIMSEDSRNSPCAPNLETFADIARGLVPSSEAAP